MSEWAGLATSARGALCAGLALSGLFLADPSRAEVSYDQLSSEGRPSNFYRTLPVAERSPEACATILAALNAPYPLRSYDLKEILLSTGLSVPWVEQQISRVNGPFYGSVRIANAPDAPDGTASQFFIHTMDAKENPVDVLYLLPESAAQEARINDGEYDAKRLKELLQGTGNRLDPNRDWIKAHYERSPPNTGTTFERHYYWADVLAVENAVYVAIASPPQFNDQLKMFGDLDIFVAPLEDGRMGTLACHFTHDSEAPE